MNLAYAAVARSLMFSGSLLLLTLPIAGQQPNASAEAQREAMHKLAFLVGRWSGPVTITRGPGEPLKLTQTENVAYKLDGLVLLIEGQSTGADGKAQFEALATVAYDDGSHTYHIRAYNAGHYVDAELKVEAGGFLWGFNTGPAKIQNIMHLTNKGEWQESTEVAFGNSPPHRSAEMLLEHQQ